MMWERAQKHERKSKVQLPWGASSILCSYGLTQGALDAPGAPYESILAAGMLLPVYCTKNQGLFYTGGMYCMFGQGRRYKTVI